MDFRVLHAYQRLARRGAVDPLACKHCGEEVLTRLGKDDEPLLHCAFCNVTVTLGLRQYEEIAKDVKEHA